MQNHSGNDAKSQVFILFDLKSLSYTMHSLGAVMKIHVQKPFPRLPPSILSFYL